MSGGYGTDYGSYAGWQVGGESQDGWLWVNQGGMPYPPAPCPHMHYPPEQAVFPDHQFLAGQPECQYYQQQPQYPNVTAVPENL